MCLYHGLGTFKRGMYAKDADGRVGVLTMDPDHDLEVRLLYADGSTSGYVRTRDLSLLDVSAVEALRCSLPQ